MGGRKNNFERVIRKLVKIDCPHVHTNEGYKTNTVRSNAECAVSCNESKSNQIYPPQEAKTFKAE